MVGMANPPRLFIDCSFLGNGPTFRFETTGPTAQAELPLPTRAPTHFKTPRMPTCEENIQAEDDLCKKQKTHIRSAKG